MLTDVSELENRYKIFIEKVVEQDAIFMLQQGDELTILDSVLFDNMEMVPFFSEATIAAAARQQDWESFEIVRIPLADFLTKWTIWMYQEDLLVAGIWSAPLVGKEFEPLELAIDIAVALKEKGTYPLEKYGDINNYLNEIFKVLKG